jgi:hypothetical protein
MNKAMVANPTMMAAYEAGIPGNGKPFPDGSKIVKIEWKPKKSTEAPFSVRIPYQSASDTFVPNLSPKPTTGEHGVSHHYSGPNIGFPRGDARLDLTDLYAFR